MIHEYAPQYVLLADKEGVELLVDVFKSLTNGKD